MEARFSEDAAEVPAAAVSYVAQQVRVPAEKWGAYDWSGRAIKRHRTEVGEAFGFPECTQEDQVQLAQWLAAALCPVELCPVEPSRDRPAEAVLARCRNDRLEPPAPAKVARLVASAVKLADEPVRVHWRYQRQGETVPGPGPSRTKRTEPGRRTR